ncbi:MAG TPA: hypothetical protein VGP93_04085 [Polyangiaceae bacterium]|nr:hypothetical protein [Polyangiaceae bacterium]
MKPHWPSRFAFPGMAGASAFCLLVACGAGSEGTNGASGSSGGSSSENGGSMSTGGGDGGATGSGGSQTTGSGGSGVSTGGGSSTAGSSGSSAVGAGGEGLYSPSPPVSIDFTGKGSFFVGEDSCDGIDNDNNGVIDDVDVGQDGICDCLKIATIGTIGPWGTSTVFQDWLNTRGADAAVALGSQVLTSDLLAPFQVIVALNLATYDFSYKGQTYSKGVDHLYTDAEASAMEGWIRGGGGLMGTIGYTRTEGAEIANINKLLLFSGMGYDPAHLDTAGDVTNWASHPTTSGMGTSRINNGVRPLITVGQTVGWDVGSRAVLQVDEIDNGRIALWGDEWITYDPFWTNVVDLDIELQWLNLIKWLTPPQQCQVPIPPIVH